MQDPALKAQSKGRDLTEGERALAEALEAIYRTGEHDFARVAEQLEAAGTPRPSGQPGGWSVETLEEELKAINASHDAAYAEHGIGA
jgi:hypothetical protein